jgi:hypothetical protein
LPRRRSPLFAGFDAVGCLEHYAVGREEPPGGRLGAGRCRHSERRTTTPSSACRRRPTRR